MVITSNQFYDHCLANDPQNFPGCRLTKCTTSAECNISAPDEMSMSMKAFDHWWCECWISQCLGKSPNSAVNSQIYRVMRLAKCWWALVPSSELLLGNGQSICCMCNVAYSVRRFPKPWSNSSDTSMGRWPPWLKYILAWMLQQSELTRSIVKLDRL